jgi:hypothetical protein
LRYVWSNYPKQSQFLWQLANDNGGICIDHRGNLVTTPPLPEDTSKPTSTTRSGG